MIGAAHTTSTGTWIVLAFVPAACTVLFFFLRHSFHDTVTAVVQQKINDEVTPQLTALGALIERVNRRIDEHMVDEKRGGDTIDTSIRGVHSELASLGRELSFLAGRTGVRTRPEAGSVEL